MPAVQPADSGERDKALKPGDVFIPRQYRVRNEAGNCVWCAAETVCWGAAGLESFKGIKDRAVKTGWRGADLWNVKKALQDAKVPFESQEAGNHDSAILYRAVEAGTGAYVEIPGHALVLVGIDAQSVRLIDNNGSRDVQAWTRNEFNHRWEGAACFPRLRRPILPIFKPPSTPVKPLPDHPPLNPEHPVEPPVTPSANPDITALAKAVAELKVQIAGMKPIAGPQGPQGLPGPAGPAGPIVRTRLEPIRK